MTGFKQLAVRGVLRMRSGHERTQAAIRDAFKAFADAGEAIAVAPNLVEGHLALAFFRNRSSAHNPRGGP